MSVHKQPSSVIPERYPLLTEYFTHLTTLSSGALALAAAFIDKLSERRQVWMAGVAIGLLAVSILLSLAAKMIVVGKSMEKEIEKEGGKRLRSRRLLKGMLQPFGVIAGATFALAFISMALFAILNLK